MSLTLDTPIMGTRAFDPSEIEVRMDHPDRKDFEFLIALEEWSHVAGIDPAVPAAQFLLETDNGKSARWNRDLNASGMGIVADNTPQPFRIESVDESARLFVQCLYSLVNRKAHPDVPLSGDVLTWFNNVWLKKVMSPAMPDVETVADLGLRYKENGDSRATWSWEEGTGPTDAYGKKLVSRLDQFYPNLPESAPPAGGGGTPVALSIRQMMIPAGNVNRPGTKLNDEPLWITIHETSNYNVGADAEMHALFCRNGGGSETVSFHGTVDDGEFIQLLPFDEVGWHAGDGCDNRDTDKGCFASVAIETCVNADGSWSVTKENLIDGCVAIIKGDSRFNFAGRKGKFSPTRLAQHNKWSGKNCPERIRAEGSWGRVTSQIASESAGTPVDPTGPEAPPANEIFTGLDIAVAKRLFGSPKGEDGKTYSFDPNGPVSKNWLARGEETGEWPALTEIWVYSDGRKYFHFEDGYTILDPAGEAPPKTLKP